MSRKNSDLREAAEGMRDLFLELLPDMGTIALFLGTACMLMRRSGTDPIGDEFRQTKGSITEWFDDRFAQRDYNNLMKADQDYHFIYVGEKWFGSKNTNYIGILPDKSCMEVSPKAGKLFNENKAQTQEQPSQKIDVPVWTGPN